MPDNCDLLTRLFGKQLVNSLASSSVLRSTASRDNFLRGFMLEETCHSMLMREHGRLAHLPTLRVVAGNEQF